ncbi:hypothetical protein [Hymenobacter cheonanensis]|uniref:hypothetical protein n=1 Tax=Hymenobacter sp. CA2-7 TaxID=3063993 RepID=UPI00271254C8|nr:hypothetical protein [Hymenobacter sp. CA2-7]MDO7887118.1 hypothetical protein [Hymenobacter sp. CA2-7]
MTKPQRTSFAVIKHLLPPDAWAVWRNEVHHGEFDDEPVLVYASDTVLESLNLDFSTQEVEHVFLILVEGNLQVKTFIYNNNTDGATGLVILGDLRASTMLVGGQEIYVTGNIAVEELFWGDYNHGSLRVLSDASVTVFAAVDYDVQINGETRIGINLTPEDESSNWQGIDIALLQATLVEKIYQLDNVIIDDETGEEEAEVELLRGEETLNWLQAGKSLLKT